MSLFCLRGEGRSTFEGTFWAFTLKPRAYLNSIDGGERIPDVAGAAHIPPGWRATAGEGNLARTRSKGGST